MPINVIVDGQLLQSKHKQQGKFVYKSLKFVELTLSPVLSKIYSVLCYIDNNDLQK